MNCCKLPSLNITSIFQVVSDTNNGRNWIYRHWSRLTQRLRYRISSEGRAKPPDWFLDKFAAKTFTDPEEPLYQTKRSKLFCGLKLAFDPTLPSHYQVCVLIFFLPLRLKEYRKHTTFLLLHIVCLF